MKDVGEAGLFMYGLSDDLKELTMMKEGRVARSYTDLQGGLGSFG